MKNAYQFYKLFNSPLAIILQVASYAVLFILIIGFSSSTKPHINYLLLVSFWYFLSEVTIHFKINKHNPEKTLNQAGENFTAAMQFPLRVRVESSKNTISLIKAINNKRENRFIKSRIGDNNTIFAEVSKNELVKKAAELAIRTGGKYISVSDMFAAYLVVSEQKTKYLEKNDLLPEDVANILHWAKQAYSQKKDKNIVLKGSGAFDFFVFGWSAELKKNAYDLTAISLRHKNPPSVIGREEEYNKLLTILSKKTSNNAILVAGPGAGKKNMISRFAYDAYTHTRTASIKTYALLAEKILSGSSSQGDTQERLELLFTDISHAGNIVIVIENIENLFGGGGYNFDMSGTLYDFLESTSIQVIGTTTEAQYESTIKSHKTAAQLFETIRLHSPDDQTLLHMIYKKSIEIEKEYNLKIKYNSLVTAINNAAVYEQATVSPGNVITLLEDSASNAARNKKKVLSTKDVEQTIEGRTHIALGEPTKQEKNKLLNLEKLIHKTVINQEAGVHAIASALRRSRSGFKEKNKPIASFLFLGPTGVGKTQTAKALAKNYFDEKNQMIRLDMSEYSTPLDAKKLLGELPNQPKDKSLIHVVQSNPFSLILLDEFEKAHPQVHNLFLQVFDDARISNDQGETADFSNSILIATSNAGSEKIRETIEQTQNETYKKQIVNDLLTSKVFAPELINRFTEVVMFTPLSKDHAQQVSKLRVEEALKKLEKRNILIKADEKAINKISTEGYSQEFGARNILRYIEANVEELISNAILENVVKKGSKATLSLDQAGNFVIVLNT